jgi:sortase (surface protein transpeptidase)
VSSPSSATTAGHSWRKWWMVAGALLLIAAGSAVFSLQSHSSQRVLAAPVRLHGAPHDAPLPPANLPPSTLPLAPVTPLIVRSVPLELRIPAIGLSTTLGTLGLNADGTVQVPTDIAQAGWYRFGPTPGQIGSAVILGHVDSYRGPAVFYQLRNLVAGDFISVTLADGATALFKVTSVAMYLKSAFPSQAVYASHGSSALQLVTCGGVFDPHTGHYLSNTVVYTALVATTPATALTGSPVTPGV